MKKLLLLLVLCVSAMVMATTPQGALNGKFTINANGDQVVFSQGNLQYMAASMMYCFAENQYDTIGSANANIGPRNGTAIDLFGWGTGANPTQASTSDADYATFTDWGTNPISNGGSQASLWRTLNADEWTYIFFTRSNAATLFGHGTVNGIKGLIILPDDWQTPARMTFISSTAAGMTNKGSYYGNGTMDFFTTNTYTAREWYTMQSSGAVFLPVAGERNGTACNFSNFAQYWASSTKLSNAGAVIGSALSFGPYDVVPSNGYNQHLGHAVRLVHDEPAAVTPVVECPVAHYNLSSADNALHMEVGQTVSIPELLGGAGSILPLSARTVEGILVAELTEDDMIHAVGAGTARFVGGYMYAVDGRTMLCEYSFDIIVTAAQQTKLSPEMSFDETEVNAELGMPFTPPTFHNPHNVPINKWNSQNMNVAEVSEDGSVVTIKAVGDAYIFCESYETDTYYAQSVGYTIHVTTSGLTIGGVTVNSGNASNIFGNGTAWYDAPTHTLYLSGYSYTGQQIPTGAPAHVKAAGSGNNAAISYTNHETLTIMVLAPSEIRNAETCVYAPNAAVVVMGNGRGGHLVLDATMVAVSTVAFKIHQCWLSASGTSAALALGQLLGMSRGSYLLAESNGVAIQCKLFEMTTEVEDGYEINILTEGVYFKQNAGFYNSANQYAKLVEIGKKAVVVPNDEITTIDFTQTDPEGNESVVFSADANNTFNEETGQLELTTALTDEVVAQALENLLPGSGAWVAALPGSIVFDIPAGQGKIKVQFMTFPGYELKVLVEGAASISITSAELGWSTVEYNVLNPVHVVIYLHAASGASAPARIATNANDVVSAGAYVQSVMILPNDAPASQDDHTAIDILEANQGENGKIMMNGQLYIIREGRVFNAAGAQVK